LEPVLSINEQGEDDDNDARGALFLLAVLAVCGLAAAPCL
jgi:hypothetical protein